MYSLEELCKIAKQLSQGIDPITGRVFEEDTIINGKFIKEYNMQVAKLIQNIMNNNDKNNVFYLDVDYVLSDDQISSFSFTKEELSISALCRQINEAKSPNIRPIKASAIAEGLYRNGFISQVDTEIASRTVTEKGKAIGIRSGEREDSSGSRYKVLLYNQNAQRYIVNNINELIK
jgi:hypothetical protein